VIVDCVPPCSLLFEEEWIDAIELVKLAKPSIPCREVFLLVMQMSIYTATLPGDRQPPVRRER
jgi:hypothetical protein